MSTKTLEERVAELSLWREEAVSEPNEDLPGALPFGETCGDCKHFARCQAFGFTPGPTSTACDFIPIRFAPSASTSPNSSHPHPPERT